MNQGTLQHVEKGDIGLPDAKRQALIDVLTEAMQQIGQTIERQEFSQLADLIINSTVPLHSCRLLLNLTWKIF